MPSYNMAIELAHERPAFSNGTEGYAWMENWCVRCVHEENPDENGGCPLLLASMLGRTPRQWEELDPGSLGNQYRCTLFQEAGS